MGATSKTKVERNSWLLDGQVDVGYSGAALVVVEDNRVGVAGVVWGVSSVIPTASSTSVEYSANGVQTTSTAQTKGVSYATQISELKKLLAHVDIAAADNGNINITHADITVDNETGVDHGTDASDHGNRC